MSEPAEQTQLPDLVEPSGDIMADLLGEDGGESGVDELLGDEPGDEPTDAEPDVEPDEEVPDADADEDPDADLEGEDEDEDDPEGEDEDDDDEEQGEDEPKPQKLSRRAKERAKWQAQVDEQSARANQAEAALTTSQGETQRVIQIATEAQKVAATKDVELQHALNQLAAFEAQGNALDPLVMQNLELQKKLYAQSQQVQAGEEQVRHQQQQRASAESVRIASTVASVAQELGVSDEFLAFKVGNAIRAGEIGRDEAGIRQVAAKLAGKKRVQAKVARTKPKSRAPSVPKPKKAAAKSYDRTNPDSLWAEIADDPNIG